MTPALETRALSLSIGGQQVADALSLRLAPGQTLAVLGQNGIGKSTLLLALAGLPLPATARLGGEIRLFGKRYADWPKREAARCRAWLGQQPPETAGSVYEAALSGRLPWLPRWGRESAEDRALAEAALAEVGLMPLRDRPLSTLSGGQRQRAWLAALLAQNAPLMLADEPIAHLDVRHQLALLARFGARAGQGAATVLALHDPTLAARFADTALLLFGDGQSLCGPTAQVLTAETLTRLYGHPMRQIDDQGSAVFVAG